MSLKPKSLWQLCGLTRAAALWIYMYNLKLWAKLFLIRKIYWAFVDHGLFILHIRCMWNNKTTDLRSTFLNNYCCVDTICIWSIFYQIILAYNAICYGLIYSLLEKWSSEQLVACLVGDNMDVVKHLIVGLTQRVHRMCGPRSPCCFRGTITMGWSETKWAMVHIGGRSAGCCTYRRQ